MPDIREAMFPYGMAKNPDGSWTFFNRKYKPLGVVGGDWADWDDSRHKIHLTGVSSAILAKLDHKEEGLGDRVYFYDDASNPAQSASNLNGYFEKLKILIRLQEKAG